VIVRAPASLRRVIRSPKRMLTLALAFFLTLAGTTVAQASWTAPGVPVSASVSAGTLGIIQSGFTPAAFTYTSSALSTTSVVTLTNNGSVPAPYTLTLSAPSTGLATGIDLRAVLVASPEACTTAAAAAGTAPQNWASTVVLTGSGTTALAVGASANFCVSSTITQAQRFALVGISAATKVTLASSIGNWVSATTTLSATQTVANTLTPGAPVASATTDHGTTLTWASPVDALAIGSYQIFRGSVLAGTTTAPITTFTDTTANVGTTYVYTVKAVDAAADASLPSPGTSVKTLGIDPSAWYKVKIAGTETCIDGERVDPTSGTLLIFYGCKPTSFDNQAWKFTVVSGTTYTVLAKYAPLNWDLAKGNVNADIQTVDGRSSSQLWSVVPIVAGNGTFTIKNNQTGKCLDNTNTATPLNDIQVVTKACVPSATQSFTLTNVG
jgi:hypothetical protein